MSLADFHFIRPYWLLALLVLAVLVFLSFKNKLNQSNWAEVCDAELLPYILQDKPSAQSRWLFGGLSLAAVLAIMALAGPTWERLPSPAFRNDAALVIALDLSQSMYASDIKPSRLVRARYKIADILRQRKDGLSALVVYSGDAFTVTPLTHDTATIESQLSSLSPNIMPSSGKNTAAALTQAVELLQQAGQQQGSILLVSDGVNKDSIEQLVKLSVGYRLSVLGVASNEGAPVKLAGGGFLKDTDGNILVPKLDRSTLALLASKGKGVYTTISDNDSDVNRLLADLDRPQLEGASSQNNGLIDQWDEQGVWLLLLILPLAALSFRKGILVFLLVLILPMPQTSYAFGWQDLWATKDQQAQQAFKNKQFEQAAEQFQSTEWKAAAQYKAGQYQHAAEALKPIETADGFYNQGNALAKAGQLKEAKQAYEKSLKLKPNDEDALYNLKLVEEALQKQQQNQDQNQQNKEQQDNQQPGESDQQQQQSAEQPSQDAQQDPQQSNQSDETDQSDQQKQQDEQKSDEQADEQAQADEAEQSAEQDAAEQAATPTGPMDENEQANEQLLNRIKDDPAGLLKRKFRYQYGQRRQQ
jgi:Ca-activated chloride channel family protein